MQNADELVVAARGNIQLAPLGTTLPEDLGDLDASFEDLGLVDENGSSISYAEARQDIMSWQVPTAVRRIVTGRDFSATYALQQFNSPNVKLAFGGGEWTEPTTGVFRYDPPDDDDPLAEYSQVIDFYDGDRHGRFVIPRGAVNEDVQTSLVRSAASVLPVAFKALDAGDLADSNWYFLSNDDAFVVPGS